MPLSKARPGMMPNETMTMLLVRTVLCGSLVAAAGLPAAAQDTASKLTGFLCEIDLQDSSPGRLAYNINQAPYVSSPVAEGVVYTFESTKLCTNSQTSENIKIDCSGKIPNWQGGSLVLNNVACTVSGAPCGIAGAPLEAINNKLAVDAQGNAVLTCQVK